MKNKYSLLVSSCDKYEDMWIPFFKLLRHYWPSFNKDIYLCTERKKFEFSPFNIKCPLSEQAKLYTSWSEMLEVVLKNMDTDYVLFMLDDFWLQDYVKPEIIDKSISYLDENDDIGFICLIPQSKGNLDCEYNELYEKKKNQSYRITTQAGLWRKKYLIKLLRSHESAWFFETRASWRSNFYYNEKVYVVKPEYSAFTYPSGGVVWRGKFVEEYIKTYPKDIQDNYIKRPFYVPESLSSNKPTRYSLSYIWNALLSLRPKF